MNAPDRLGLTPEDHAERLKGVGASEVAEALDLSAELWALKTRRLAPSQDDAFSRLGLAIQDYTIGEMWRQIAAAPDRFCGHALYARPQGHRRGRLIAHPDAEIFSGDRIVATVEAKWRAHRDGWGEPGTDAIPDAVALQVTQQALLSGATLCIVPVLFMRPPVVVYEMPFDPELGEIIEAGVDRFWWYVEHDEPPPVNADRPEALAALRLLYKETDGTRLTATPELAQWRGVYHEAAALRDRYEGVAEAAKAHLLAAMKGASELDFGDEVFRRKLIKVKGYTVEEREQIDTRFIKAKGGKE